MDRSILFRPCKSAAVVGLGYVGLPTAALIASGGVNTLGVDINDQLVTDLNLGKFNPKEPGLKQLLEESISIGKLTFSRQLESRDTYIIAVPTPINPDNSPSLEYVFNAAAEIAKVLHSGQLIVLESTSPPGATSLLASEIGRLRPDLDVSGKGLESVKFAYCPERVLPGNALYEILNNERLIGGLTEESALMAENLYANFTRGKIVVCTDLEAEMAKLVENSFRDVNIAFANEVARIASTLQVSAEKVIELANRHPRVNILSPGIGVGGHCISVDPWFLVHAAPYQANLIKAARDINDNQPTLLAKEVLELFSDRNFRRIICLGLSYKPNSDDLRESPAIDFVRNILESRPDVEVYVVEPNIDINQIDALFSGKCWGGLPSNGLSQNDLVLKLVSHKEFEHIDMGQAITLELSGTGQVNY